MSEYGNVYDMLSPDVAGRMGTLHFLKQQELQELLKTVDTERRVFLGSWVSGVRIVHREWNALKRALNEGMKPSAYADKELRWVLDKGFVSAAYWPEMLAAMDRLLEQPYATSWSRRSYRSPNYDAYTERVQSMLQAFVNDVLLPYKVADLLTGHVPSTVTEYTSKVGIAHRTCW